MNDLLCVGLQRWIHVSFSTQKEISKRQDALDFPLVNIFFLSYLGKGESNIR